MSNLPAVKNDFSTIEQVVVNGDLSKLNAEQRVTYYRQVCNSLGLNPFTRPFDYITLNNKLTLYARKDAADQLRSKHGISIDKPDIRFEDEWIIVTVVAKDADGRTDSDIGVVKKTDMQGNLGNALMKAVTKAKRRVTLSICGLGMLDETEIETIPNARPVVVAETGEIVDSTMVTTAVKDLGAEVKEVSTEPDALESLTLQELMQANNDLCDRKKQNGLTDDDRAAIEAKIKRVQKLIAEKRGKN